MQLGKPHVTYLHPCYRPQGKTPAKPRTILPTVQAVAGVVVVASLAIGYLTILVSLIFV